MVHQRLHSSLIRRAQEGPIRTFQTTRLAASMRRTHSGRLAAEGHRRFAAKGRTSAAPLNARLAADRDAIPPSHCALTSPTTSP